MDTAVCVALGVDRLAQRKVVSDDPDLRADREPPGRFFRIANFLLRHAAELFEPQDADALLAGEMRERARKTMYPLISSGWAIGAAELQPARASEILRAAMGRFRGYEATGSALAAAALWRIRGATEVEFLADWFYARDEEVPGLANVPGLFLREAGAAWRADTPELLRALVASARFELTDWESLRGMLALASLNRAPPLVDERQISEAYRAVDRQVTFSHWRNLLRRECGFSELPPPARVEARDAFTQPTWSVPLESEPRQIAFSPDGKTCAVVGAKSACELRDVASGKLLWKIPHPVRVLAVAFHENASRLTLFDRNLSDWNWRFSEWDVAKRERVRETALQDLPSEGLDGAHVFDRTVSRFAVVGGHTISCFDVHTGTAVWQQRDDRAKPYAIAAMSANGQLLAAGGQSRVVRIFDAAKGELLRTIDGHSGSVVALVLSADGQTLVTATNEHLVSWWDTSTGALRKRFVYPMQRAGIMTASADARRLALTSAAAPGGEYQVGIFDLQSGALRSQLRGRRNNYTTPAAALAPNGEWLLVGSVEPAHLDGWSMENR